jgi:hypothetical protein
MKRIGLLIGLFLSSVLVAQDAKKDAEALNAETGKLKGDTSNVRWKKGGTVNLAAQQVSLTNWAAGGQSAISANAMSSLFTVYKYKKHLWSSNLEAAYGVIKQGSNRKWWKNDDRLQFNTKYGYKAIDHVYYTVLGDFKSQFAAGYNYPNDSVIISNFMAPAYVVLAFGFDYTPNKNVSVFLAPVTARVTIVNDDTLARYGAFGVQKEVRDAAGQVTTPYRKMREQAGGYFKLQLKKNVMENVEFSTMLELFSDYLDNPLNLYVNWTTLTTMKVNKFISATLNTQLIYDEAVMIKDKDGKVGPRVQFRQVLGLGLAYKF